MCFLVSVTFQCFNVFFYVLFEYCSTAITALSTMKAEGVTLVIGETAPSLRNWVDWSNWGGHTMTSSEINQTGGHVKSKFQTILLRCGLLLLLFVILPPLCIQTAGI